VSNTLLLASGCFWSKEYHLSKLPGVIATEVGFAGGHVPDPTYVQVCHKTTGHAEVVSVTYDPTVLATEVLLTEFFTLHNFEIDRGRGSGQYRSAIFSVEEDEQLATARRMIDRLRRAGYAPQTEVKVVAAYYPAEARHQQYCELRGQHPERKDHAHVRALLLP
jgi:methionine-S-sulfoxide reductase